MTENNLKIWGQVCRPPQTALKQIKGGRLSGMTDIKPQWRYMVMTELYGPVGTGWYYRTTRKWTEQGSAEQIMAMVDIELYVKSRGEWSMPIEGTGGSMLITKESKGLHTSDEAYKMATTDALSTAMKLLGVGADIYMGQYNGSKYVQESSGKPTTPKKTSADIIATDKADTLEQFEAWVVEVTPHVRADLDRVDLGKFKKYLGERRDAFSPKNPQFLICPNNNKGMPVADCAVSDCHETCKDYQDAVK